MKHMQSNLDNRLSAVEKTLMDSIKKEQLQDEAIVSVIHSQSRTNYVLDTINKAMVAIPTYDDLETVRAEMLNHDLFGISDDVNDPAGHHLAEELQRASESTEEWPLDPADEVSVDPTYQPSVDVSSSVDATDKSSVVESSIQSSVDATHKLLVQISVAAADDVTIPHVQSESPSVDHQGDSGPGPDSEERV
jgi:hypothetical protein